jgi:Tetratricopeptide repeat
MKGIVYLYYALVGLGEIQRRRGLLADAIHAFLQGREKARQWGISLVESRTLLGLGDMYRQRGQPELAERMYLEAKACIERPGIPGGIQ